MKLWSMLTLIPGPLLIAFGTTNEAQGIGVFLLVMSPPGLALLGVAAIANLFRD